MSNHTALLPLPALLTAAGFNVEVADGWEQGQCRTSHYLWTSPAGVKSHDQEPSGYMVHHTAGTAASPPPHDTSKANAWIGLKRGDRLYQTGGGVPTIYLASAGPALISSGYGYKPALWSHTFLDLRAPAHAEGSDTDTAGNRYVFNVETVHPGNGSVLDAGVWDHVVGLGVALHQMFGWTERTLGHLSWTNRKIDPRWSVGLPNDGSECIVDVQNEIATRLTGTPPVPPAEPPIVVEPAPVDQGRNQLYVKQGMSGQDVEYWQVRSIEAVTGVKFYGTSARAFIQTEAPQLTWKVWDQAMTDFLSAWTGRNSYGVGGSERVIIENAIAVLYSS